MHNREELPKKYLRKMFNKPHKAYCKKCMINNRRHKMFLLPEDANPGKILFKCTNSECGDILDLTPFLDKGFKLNKSKLHKMIPILNIGNFMEMSRTLHHYRIKDQYYNIDDKTIYNPITRMRCIGSLRFKATQEEHNKFLDIIHSLLNNAKSE